MRTESFMRCAACNRSLTRAAYSVGRLNFGPTCFKKLLAEGRKAKRVELDLLPAGDLLDFDRPVSDDSLCTVMGVAA